MSLSKAMSFSTSFNVSLHCSKTTCPLLLGTFFLFIIIRQVSVTNMDHKCALSCCLRCNKNNNAVKGVEGCWVEFEESSEGYFEPFLACWAITLFYEKYFYLHSSMNFIIWPHMKNEKSHCYFASCIFIIFSIEGWKIMFDPRPWSDWIHRAIENENEILEWWKLPKAPFVLL